MRKNIENDIPSRRNYKCVFYLLSPVNIFPNSHLYKGHWDRYKQAQIQRPQDLTGGSHHTYNLLSESFCLSFPGSQQKTPNWSVQPRKVSFPRQSSRIKLMVRWSWVTPHWRCQKFRLSKVGVQVGVYAVSCAYERVGCWDWFTLNPPSVCRLIANRLGSQPIIIINPGPCHTIIHWNAMKMEKVTRASLLIHIFFSGH